MRPTLRTAAGPLAVAWALVPPPAVAQSSGTLDVGVSSVRYDDSLASGAWAVAPAIRFGGARASLALRGTYLRFEDGRTNLQGLGAGSVFLPTEGALRPELHLALGTSRYGEFAHAKAGLRLHRLGPTLSGWVGIAPGLAMPSARAQKFVTYGTGVWHARRILNVSLAATRTVLGDAAYTDFESTLRVRWGRLEFDGWLGARVWSQGSARGVYGDAAFAAWVLEPLALTLGTGRYLADVTRGTIATRYATAGVRLTGPLRRPSAIHPPRGTSPPIHVAASSVERPVASLVQLRREGGGRYAFRVEAPGARTVELAGDFTDWEPVPLARGPDGTWEVALPLTRGSHWLNIRIDEGSWVAPLGVPTTADDFGAEVAMITVP